MLPSPFLTKQNLVDEKRRWIIGKIFFNFRIRQKEIRWKNPHCYSFLWCFVLLWEKFYVSASQKYSVRSYMHTFQAIHLNILCFVSSTPKTLSLIGIRGLSQKFVDNHHLTFFNENKELKPISWYTSLYMRGLYGKLFESIQKYRNYSTFCNAWYAAAGHVTSFMHLYLHCRLFTYHSWE